MATIGTENLCPPRAQISWSEGVLRLHDQDLFGNGLSEGCSSFLRHVFTLHEVNCVELDCTLSNAQIHYDVAHVRLSDFLLRLATALRSAIPRHVNLPSTLARDLADSTGPVNIRQFGTLLTTWEVVYSRPGRIRLRHPTILRNATLANRLRSMISRIAGVTTQAVRPVTGSVLVQFDPAVTSVSELLQLLDDARYSPQLTEQLPANTNAVGFKLANSSLALAVAGEAVAPVLLPVSAALLIGSNLDTFRGAIRQLVLGAWGCPFYIRALSRQPSSAGNSLPLPP